MLFLIIVFFVLLVFFSFKLKKTLHIIIMSVLCSLYTVIFGIYSEFSFFLIAVIVLCFLSTSCGILYFKFKEKKNVHKIERNTNLTKQTLDKLELKVKELKKINEELSFQVNEISNLYEVTKKMSKALEFEEVFKIFTNIIKEKFNFKECKFIILRNPDSVSRIYSIHKEEIMNKKKEVPIVDLKEIDLKIIDKINQIKTSFYISKENKTPKDIEISPDLCLQDSLTAIPMISDNQVIAILSITGLDYKEYPNLLIFAGQFSLQMKKVRLYERIHELAIKDDLTGVYVRRYFLEKSKEEFKRAVKHNLNYPMLMLDIDHFKEHNDTYGHLVGDRLLKNIADIIISAVREIDLVGRYGGEEFALILPDTDLQGAYLVAERIRKQIENHKFHVYDEEINITASIGICIYPEHTSFFDSLINNADMALYRAKNEGRNKTCVYDEKIDKIRFHKL